MVAVSAVLTALLVRPISQPVIAGVVTAVAGLVASYGTALSDVTIAAVMAVAYGLLNMFVVQPQVSPQETPVTSA